MMTLYVTMRNTLTILISALIFQLGFLSLAGAAEQATISPQIRSQWAVATTQTEPNKDHGFYLMAKNEWQILKTSRLAKRFQNTYTAFKIALNFPTEREQLEHFDAVKGGGLENALASINDGISDAVMLIKSPLYALSRLSHRIEVCTINLAAPMSLPSFVQPIMPALHIGILVDQQEKFVDAGGGGLVRKSNHGAPLACTPIPVFNNQSDSLAIERLLCTAELFKTDYSIFEYNCGAYTKDLLKASNLGYPIFPNVGIGTEIPAVNTPGFAFYALKMRQLFQKLNKAQTACDTHVNALSRLIFAWEQKTTNPAAMRDVLSTGDIFGSDAKLQLVISAARSKNDAIRIDAQSMQSHLYITLNDYLNDQTSIKAELKPLLSSMFTNLDDESLSWMRRYFPTAFELYQKLSKS